ncbi:hypothetical protein ACFPPD_12290 [Cohnella suwonensis]|uniref:Lipoprotein n=1 Tax=Cohnella suwonensis TaxID=696072 RepID=A0ABW0LUV8_9BACL
MLKKQILAVILVILGCISLAGCGNSSDNSSEGDQSTIEYKVSEDGDTISLSADDTLPEGFPKEIPIIEGSFSQVALSSDSSMTVSYDVKKSFKEVLKVYKDYYKSAGYTDMQETLIDDSYMGTGVRDGKQLLVTLSVNTDDLNLTSVSLTYQDEVKS